MDNKMTDTFKSLFAYGSAHVTQILVTAASLIIIGLMLFIFLKILEKYRAKHPSNSFFLAVIDHLIKPLCIFIPLLLLQIILPLFIEKKLLEDTNRLLQPLFVLTIAWLLIACVFIGEDWLKIKYNVDKIDNIRERRIRTSILFIKRITIIVIVVFAIGFILLSFQNVRKIGTGILASAGVAGIIIGFAAQKSLSNILAGLQIAFTQPIRIDDVVVVEGEWGRIEEISLTFVVIRIWDQRRLILPINYFLEKPFQNWTRRTAEIIGTVFLYTDYSIDVEALRNELTRILLSTPLWDNKVNVLQVTNASEKTLELRALVSARNSQNAWDLRCLVREKLLQYLEKNFPESLPKFRIEKSAPS